MDDGLPNRTALLTESSLRLSLMAPSSVESGLNRKSPGFEDEEVGDWSVPNVNDERGEGDPPASLQQLYAEFFYELTSRTTHAKDHFILQSEVTKLNTDRNTIELNEERNGNGNKD